MSEKTVFDERAGTRVRPGTRLNDLYQIDRLIAVGGMGEVYQGHAIETGDQVAIKTIRPDLAESGPALALFRKEASALHNLHHGAIVRYYVFSVDRLLDLPYLAMEFVEGEALSTILERGALSSDALEILRRRLASGLQVAHEAGIIHRDVSPDNVILPAGNPARAKIIDFGIARSTLSGQTVIGDGFAGKYSYVSPEQLGLQGGVVTARSDIYSLGLVLTAAALGRAVDMGANPADVIERRSRVPDLGGVDPRLRPLLEAMLNPNPDGRPASMAEVAAWSPVTTEKAPAARQETPGPRRRTPAIIGGGLVLSVLAAGGSAFLWRTPDREPAKEQGALLEEGTEASTARSTREQNEFTAGPPPMDSERAKSTPAPADPPRIAEPFEPPASAPPAAPPPEPIPDGAGDRPRPLPPDPRIASKDPDPLSTRPPTASAPSMEQVAAYIREYRGGDCFYLNPLAVSAREAAVEAYGFASAPFTAFDSAFTAALGFEPKIQLRQIDRPQCPVIDILAQQAVQRRARAPKLVLQRDRIRSGEELRGTIELAEDVNLELLLVDGDGTAHNLAPHLIRKGRQASFALRLETPTSQPARSQLIVAVSSPDSLAFVRDRRNTRTDEIFRQIGEQATRPGSPIGLAVRYIKLGS